jgi:ATP-dependent helicase/nuclease subunit A
MRVDLERKIKYPTMARHCIQEALARENKAEEQRILYVAMTRPKEKLILVDAMYGAEGRMKSLTPLAACPALPESVGAGRNFADWLLLPLLCRPEAAPLRQLADMEAEALYTGDTAHWEIALHDAESFRQAPAASGWSGGGGETEASFDPALIEFVYPHQTETGLPAKLTATQLKGREVDSEIAESAAVPPPPLRPLTRPRFRQGLSGLTAAESGTATHLVLQYLDFSDLDVAGQVAVLQERHLLTEEQASAVGTAELRRFLCSALAEELRQSPEILREYPFTVLMDAAAVEPTATGERILLQGIVDCCFTQPDGTLAVVDFKTDRVSGQALRHRAEHYRPQLEAYSQALERVLEKAVTRRILYFLHAGEAVEL